VAPATTTYLLILGEREAVAWVLQEKRMAFPSGRATAARRLKIGDRLLIYTTRLCFHYPSLDRGRVVGTAVVESEVGALEPPLTIAGREFTTGCSLIVEGLAAFRQGVELAPLVPLLSIFPNPATWSIHMRRPLLALPAVDSRILERKLRPMLHAPADVIDGYLAAARSASKKGLKERWLLPGWPAATNEGQAPTSIDNL
jgi:hypothetical protein